MVVLTSLCPISCCTGPDIASVLEQVRREGMSEDVTRDSFFNAGRSAAGADGTLQRIFENVVAAPKLRFLIPTQVWPRERRIATAMTARGSGTCAQERTATLYGRGHPPGR